MLLREIRANGPGEKKQGRSDLQNSARPILDAAVGRHTKHHQGTDADADEFHCLLGSADSGTRATSSIQADPRILLSNFALGRRLAHISNSRTSLPEVQGSSTLVHGCVPSTSSVQATGLAESPMECSPKRTP